MFACGTLRIAITNPEYASDLCAHFKRSGFDVQLVSDGIIEVGLREAPNPHQERLEVALQLRVWEAMNPAESVKLVR
jgi:hypothetical protein